MVEVKKAQIIDMGDGNFGDGVCALKEAGVYIYESDKELGKYYISAELLTAEMQEFEVHEVFPGWRFWLKGSDGYMGAVLLADIIATNLDGVDVNRSALRDVLLDNSDYFRLGAIVGDAERARSIKE